MPASVIRRICCILAVTPFACVVAFGQTGISPASRPNAASGAAPTVQNTANSGQTAATASRGGDNPGGIGYGLSEGIDPRNSLFGARGDGSADDTRALDNWFQYEVQHRGPVLLLPTPPVCYKVSAPLNWGGFSGVVIVMGEGRGLMDTSSASTPSKICYTNAITPTQPVIDGSNHGSLVIDGITVVPLNGIISAGTCILIQPDNKGGTTSATVTHSNLQCGAGAGNNAVAIIAADVSTVYGNSIRSNGNGIVIGQLKGPSLATSPYYTPLTGYGVTHVTVLANDIRTSRSPIVGTGNCGDYTIGDSGGVGYIAEIAPGDPSHGIVDFSYAASNGCRGFKLNLTSVNIENQTHKALLAVISTGSPSDGVSVTGGFWSGRLGGAPTMNGQFDGVTGSFDTSGTFFGDTTNCEMCDIGDPSHGMHLSPTAGGTPGFSGNLSGSTITGFTWNLSTIAEQLPAGQAGVKLCRNQGATADCYTVGQWGAPSNAAQHILGVLDLTQGGYMALMDRSTLTLSAGTASVKLSGHYNVDPDCYANWTGSGALTGLYSVAQTALGHGQWKLTVTSSVRTDTATFRYSCFGY